MSTITVSQMKELLAGQSETLLKAIGELLAERVVAAAAPSEKAPKEEKSKKAPKEKKAKDPSEPKVPSTNPWILFCKKVETLIRAKEEADDVPKESKMKTVQTKQFASDLKAQKPYDDWTDEEILEALEGWTPPAVSKQEAAGKSKRKNSGGSSVGSAAPKDEPVADTPEEKPVEKPAPAKAEPAPAPAPPKAEPAPAKAEPKKVQIKKKEAAPQPKKELDLRFYPWSHDGKAYYTNERGDVVSEDFEWVGRFDGTKIDQTVPEPADLANAEMKD